jgi:hypothetical protein
VFAALSRGCWEKSRCSWRSGRRVLGKGNGRDRTGRTDQTSQTSRTGRTDRTHSRSKNRSSFVSPDFFGCGSSALRITSYVLCAPVAFLDDFLNIAPKLSPFIDPPDRAILYINSLEHKNLRSCWPWGIQFAPTPFFPSTINHQPFPIFPISYAYTLALPDHPERGL